MNRFEGIVFDLDKTAVPAGAMSVESDELIEAFQAMPDDVVAIAATGRPLETALPIVQALGLKHDSVVANGALVVDPQTGEPWRERMLSKDQVGAIFSICTEHPDSLLLGGDPKNGSRLRLRDQEEEPEPSVSAYLIDIPEKAAKEAYAQITEIPGVYVYLAGSWSGAAGMFNVCVSHTEARKGNALGAVFGKYAIDASKIIGVGDGTNDIELFTAVGYRIAVGDAEPELIEQADEVVAPHNEGGLAEVVRRFSR